MFFIAGRLALPRFNFDLTAQTDGPAPLGPPCLAKQPARHSLSLLHTELLHTIRSTHAQAPLR